MLKHRLIPCLILKDGRIVQSIRFKRYLPIGCPEIAIEFFVNWDVDEIVLLDIDATKQGRKPRIDLIELFTRKCFVPLTIGGGISSLDDIRDVLKAGADKVSINSAGLKRPQFIQEAVARFGSQCITVSIDAKLNVDNEYEVFVDSGKVATGRNPVSWALEAEALGAGEILLNSIERDGTKQGYDLKLVRMITEAVNVPVITCGGVGKMHHFVEGVQEGGAQAVAAANIFQYTEHSTIIAKAYLKKEGIPVRLNSPVKYEGIQIDDYGRIV